MPMDLEIRKFEESLVMHIKHSKLPIEIRRLIVQEICSKITEMANEEIYNQQKQEKQNVIASKGANKDAKSVQQDILGEQAK